MKDNSRQQSINITIPKTKMNVWHAKIIKMRKKTSKANKKTNTFQKVLETHKTKRILTKKKNK